MSKQNEINDKKEENGQKKNRSKEAAVPAQAVSQTQVESKHKAETVAQAETKPVSRAEIRTAVKNEAKPVSRAEIRTAVKNEAKPVSRAEIKTVAKSEAKPMDADQASTKTKAEAGSGEKALTREEHRMLQEEEKGKKKKKRERKGRLRIFPVWLKIIFSLALFAASFGAGLMFGYGVIGDGEEPREALEKETWYGIYDFIFDDTEREREKE